MYFTADGERTTTLVIGQPCQLHIDYRAERDLPRVKLCVEVHSEKSSTTYAYVQTTADDLLKGDTVTPFSVKKGMGRITVAFSGLLMGDGAYHCDVELYPGAPDFQFAYEACYCHYKRLLRFQAIYKHRYYFGRGTITELPFDEITVEPNS
jgi:hypothetical protein